MLVDNGARGWILIAVLLLLALLIGLFVARSTAVRTAESERAHAIERVMQEQTRALEQQRLENEALRSQIRRR